MSTKIVVLGETNAGKTSFCHAVAGKPALDFPSTFGATVIMAWHDYRAGTPEQRAELMEFWDIGGAAATRQTSQVFFDGAAGAILVHDLSNKKSEENLGPWLTMLDGKQRTGATGPLLVDLESCHVPVLIVGCKADLAPHRVPNSYDRLHIDSRKIIQRGSPNFTILSRFFDSCIDRTKGPAALPRRPRHPDYGNNSTIDYTNTSNYSANFTYS